MQYSKDTNYVWTNKMSLIYWRKKRDRRIYWTLKRYEWTSVWAGQTINLTEIKGAQYRVTRSKSLYRDKEVGDHVKILKIISGL